MESLRNIISDIRIFLYGGVQTFPLTIAGTLAVLGLFTANYAIMFFLLGFLILTPLLSSLLNFTIGNFFEGTSFNPFKTKTSDVCKLVIPTTTLKAPVGTADENVVSSYWTAMVSFFIGYMFTNSVYLFNRQAEDVTLDIKTNSTSDIDKKVTARKSQAMIAMISILIFGFILLGFRYYTGCETVTGMIFTSAAFISAGHGWYRALSSVGQDRLSDLFGIANRLLPPSAIANAPIACIPIRA